MPAKKREDMTPEELREHNAAEARRANDNRNQSQLDRRNAIADAVDDVRDPEMDDVDGDRIVPRKKARDPEDEEEAARLEDERAERERARLEAQDGPDDPDEDDERDDEDDSSEGDSKIINGVRHYLQIVNGKQKWQTLQQIRASAQKVESADEYLQQAAASVRNAARIDEPDDSSDDEEDDTDLEDVVNKALLGDQESVKKLARRLKATPSRVTPDVLQAVDERLTFRAALDWFEDEFADELGDPLLKKLIVEEDAKLAQDNPTWSYRKRLKTAGEKIRNWKTELSGGRPGGKPQESAKERRKREASSVPSAGGRQQESADDDQDVPISEQINAMAKGRHQGRAVKH